MFQVSDGGSVTQWDSFLRSHDSDQHLQSSLWSQVKSLNGWKTRRITVSDGKQIVGGAQLLMRKVKYLGTIGYVPKGPVLTGENESLARQLLEKIGEISTAERLQVLFVQPSGFGVVVSALERQGFGISPVEIASSATLLVDLSLDLDAILSRMSKGMRNRIRRSQKRGITVREGTKADLPVFHRLLSATSARHGFSTFDLEYFQGMWDILDPAGCIKLFVSELDGEAASAQFCISFGNTVVAKQIGWSGQHGHLHPNESLTGSRSNGRRTTVTNTTTLKELTEPQPGSRGRKTSARSLRRDTQFL